MFLKLTYILLDMVSTNLNFAKVLSIFILFGLLSGISALDFVLPSSFNDTSLTLLPNSKTTISFLQTFEGKQVFVDSLFCNGVSCSVVKSDGPYFLFEVTAGSLSQGKVDLKYHYKGFTEELSKTIIVNVDSKAFTVVPFVANDYRLLEKYETKVLVKNDSDAKLKGKISANFPEDIFAPIDFEMDSKSQKEYTTTFWPKNAGYFDMVLNLQLEGLEKKEIFAKTVFVKKDLFNLFAMSHTSYLPTNPQLELYSSILSFLYFLK